MTDTTDTAHPVTAAWNTLIAALKTEAVNGDFERTATFLAKQRDQQDRWASGRPSHGPRAAKGEA